MSIPLRFKVVEPMVYVSTDIWLVYQCPLTKSVELFKTPMTTNLIDALKNSPWKKLQQYLEQKYNTAIILEDHGRWDNIQANGEYIHPFTKERVKV